MANNLVSAGTPCNTRSMLAFIFSQMEKLDRGDINSATAYAQAQLGRVAIGILNYELNRANMQMKMHQLGLIEDKSEVCIRNVESKPFNKQ